MECFLRSSCHDAIRTAHTDIPATRKNVNDGNDRCMKYNISLRLLNYAHIIYKSCEVRAELLKDASTEVFAVTAPVTRRDASLIRFLEEKQIIIITTFLF